MHFIYIVLFDAGSEPEPIKKKNQIIIDKGFVSKAVYISPQKTSLDCCQCKDSYTPLPKLLPPSSYHIGSTAVRVAYCRPFDFANDMYCNALPHPFSYLIVVFLQSNKHYPIFINLLIV